MATSVALAVAGVQVQRLAKPLVKGAADAWGMDSDWRRGVAETATEGFYVLYVKGK